MTSYYELLGVAVDADQSELRRAYHRKAQLLHPDRYAGTPTPQRRRAEDEMKALNAAWTTLRNPETRRRYDVERGLVAADRENQPLDDGPEAEGGPPRGSSGFPRARTRVTVALVLVLTIVGSVIAAVAQSDDQPPRWSARAVAELRFAALNAGLSAPQAECFVEAITSRFGPSEPVDRTVTHQLLDACQ